MMRGEMRDGRSATGGPRTTDVRRPRCSQTDREAVNEPVGQSTGWAPWVVATWRYGVPMTATTSLDRIRELCARLPEVHEELTWGEDLTIRVGKKIFCFPGETAFTVKADKTELIALLDDPRIVPAAYVGRFGWVTVQLDDPVDWDQVDRLIRQSYRLIAPKRLAAQVP